MPFEFSDPDPTEAAGNANLAYTESWVCLLILKWCHKNAVTVNTFLHLLLKNSEGEAWG